MMERIFNFVKNHPFLMIGVVIFLIGLILFVIGLIIEGNDVWKWFTSNTAFWIYGAIGLYLVVAIGCWVSNKIRGL